MQSAIGVLGDTFADVLVRVVPEMPQWGTVGHSACVLDIHTYVHKYIIYIHI
jgi:hypothetical protein